MRRQCTQVTKQVRPPQPCVYLFLIDVSAHAISLGELTAPATAPCTGCGIYRGQCNIAGLPRAVCETILEQLNEITGDSRTKIGFITYSSTLQFYSLRVG